MTQRSTILQTRGASLAALEHEAGVFVRRAKRVVGQRARSVHPDLAGASYLMLAWLTREGPVRASALAEVFGVDKGAISRQVQNLEDLGLVVRTPDPADGRATLVAASEEAVSRLEAIARDRRQQLDERLADWTEDELATFAGMLARYNRSTLD